MKKLVEILEITDTKIVIDMLEVWPAQDLLLSAILLPPARLLLVMMLPFIFYLYFSSEFH